MSNIVLKVHRSNLETGSAPGSRKQTFAKKHKKWTLSLPIYTRYKEITVQNAVALSGFRIILILTRPVQAAALSYISAPEVSTSLTGKIDAIVCDKHFSQCLTIFYKSN